MVIRDFSKEPISDTEVLHCRWYAVINDTIGGWAISNVDQSVADLNPYEGRFELGSFLTEVEAKHIADVHNAWWDALIESSYAENYAATIDLELAEGYAKLALEQREARLQRALDRLVEDD